MRVLTLLPWSPEDLVVDEPPVHADAIVLLEGGLARIPQAVSLVEQGYATRLIYPGLAPVAREPLDRALASLSRRAELIVPDDTATESTWEEALSTRAILASRPDIDSILLVTSDYHTRRARWTFRKVLPSSVDITTIAATQRHWTPDLAREPGSARELYRRERRKMLGYLLLYGWRVMP
ncbi:MAG: YdcF family protein [Spirochaetota bacterium]